MSEYGYEKLEKYLKDHYQYFYVNIPQDAKDKIVHKVIFNNAKLFSAEDVKNDNGCYMCGRCCELQHCQNYDKESKKCIAWDKRYDICREYPWAGDYGLHLDLFCQFTVDLLVKKINSILDEYEVRQNDK